MTRFFEYILFTYIIPYMLPTYLYLIQGSSAFHFTFFQKNIRTTKEHQRDGDFYGETALFCIFSSFKNLVNNDFQPTKQAGDLETSCSVMCPSHHIRTCKVPFGTQGLPQRPTGGLWCKGWRRARLVLRRKIYVTLVKFSHKNHVVRFRK